MTRLKVHHMAEGSTPHATIAERCGVSVRSVERIVTEPVPTVQEVAAGARQGAKRIGRKPKADPAMVEEIRLLLQQNPKLPAIEVLRRFKVRGFAGGRSQMTELVKRLRPEPHQEPVVRFEGLPGEYTQFDFGECVVELDAGPVTVQFFGGRLKYSRFMHVELVPDQCAETLVRSVIACIAAFGGATKEWVFDNPKTVRISKRGVEPPVLHRYLAQLVAEYRVIPTLCTPRAGNQKGSVERLVGYVKNSFFRVRKFHDLADVKQQLEEWLHEVNHDRPCDATGIIPSVALLEELPFLEQRPPQSPAAAWAMQESATVTPMGTVSYNGTSYSATAKRLGAPATLLVRRDELEVIVGTERSVHRREDHTGEVRRLPQHREDVLAVLHGRRKVATFRRQCLLELGRPAYAFLGRLVHECPEGRWEQPCTTLYELLTVHGDDALRDAFDACVTLGDCTVEAVVAQLEAA
ncbi:MAG: IS21 family transposase [Myxococcota bacterium]